MSEKPIIFSPHNVQRIQEDSKSQTRRVVEPHRSFKIHSVCKPEGAADPWAVWFHYPETDRVGHMVECPYGKPRDTLWVRETFLYRNNGATIVYRADLSDIDAAGFGALYGGWKSPMFLPRKFARITLEITNVKVERLHDINPADVFAEGIEVPCLDDHASRETINRVAVGMYRTLWDSLHRKDGHEWNTNPHVWAISFRRIR